MSDTTDGSSNAAQSAPEDTSEDTSPGLWRRLFGAGADGDDATGDDGQPGGATRSVTVRSAQGLLDLRGMRVEDVAVPKADIVAVPVTVTRDELVATFRDSGLTRLPVFEGTLDTPIGLVNLKDFALRHGFNGGSGSFALRKILRPLLFVPPSMPLGVLLQKMQAERTHMALVIDEYGGTDGLVTLEDLIEQIVGEIEDEHDIDEGKSFTLEKPGCYVAKSKTPLEEFEAEIGRPLTDHDEIDEEEVDTLGGLVFMLAGRVPVRGEVVPHPDGFEFEVLDADPRRIKRLRVRVPDGPAATD